MNHDKREKVKELFDAALRLTPTYWQSFLAQSCPEDDLRTEVERLLKAELQRGGFLEHSFLSDTKIAPDQPPTTCQPGDFLADRFRVVRFLARGGWVRCMKRMI